MGNLTNLEDTKVFQSITDDSEDAKLNLLIPQVSSAIEEWCGRRFGKDTYTEFYMGSGTARLALNQRPVISITSVYLDDLGYWGAVDNSFGSTALLEEGVDYALEIDSPDGTSRSGLLYSIAGWWPQLNTYTPGLISPWYQPVGNIKATYVAGYTSIPSQLQLACNLAIANIRRMAQYGAPLSSETYEEWSVSYSVGLHRLIFTPEVTSLLSRFREIAIA